MVGHDIEGYMIQVIPMLTLGAIYGLFGFELAVVLGLGMLIGSVAQP